jgi:hypothetical protein
MLGSCGVLSALGEGKVVRIIGDCVVYRIIGNSLMVKEVKEGSDKWEATNIGFNYFLTKQYEVYSK